MFFLIDVLELYLSRNRTCVFNRMKESILKLNKNLIKKKKNRKTQCIKSFVFRLNLNAEKLFEVSLINCYIAFAMPHRHLHKELLVSPSMKNADLKSSTLGKLHLKIWMHRSAPFSIFLYIVAHFSLRNHPNVLPQGETHYISLYMSLIVSSIMAFSIAQQFLDPLRGQVVPVMFWALVNLQSFCLLTHLAIFFNWLPVVINAFGRRVHAARYVQFSGMYPLVGIMLESIDYDPQHSHVRIYAETLSVLLGSIGTFVQNQNIAIVLLVLSYALCFYQIEIFKDRFSKVLFPFVDVDEKRRENLRVNILSQILVAENMVYAAIYALGIFHIISDPIEHLLFGIADVYLKTLFAGTALCLVYFDLIVWLKWH